MRLMMQSLLAETPKSLFWRPRVAALLIKDTARAAALSFGF
jgi:hypothetical protein